MKYKFLAALALITIVATAPISSLAKNKNTEHQPVPGLTPHTSHVPQLTPFACSPGTATYQSGGGGHSGLTLAGANHTYQCNGNNGTAGFTVDFNNAQTVALQSITVSLTNGHNGTLNIYCDQPDGQFSTYSLPFNSLSSGTFMILPSQLTPPLAAGTLIDFITVDANPCQLVTVKNFQVNGVSGSIHLGSTPCVCIGSPPN